MSDDPATAGYQPTVPPTAPVEPNATTDYDGRSPGDLIAGRYRLLEPIGEGGMGAVWKAEQAEPVKRLVAVKVIKPGADSKSVLARFDAERQALALMDHPNIARVFDAGVSDDGRPFFVMELVRGVPITSYCEDKKLSPRDRLELFVPVCQAIQHAHQKGIIHRDIKPSNVLVAEYDGRPVPKVIDFGVAKAAGGRLTDSTLETGYGAVIGTPEYMSPEQAADSADIDTRSDVYALGVLLYEMLTGGPPHDRKRLKAAGLLEVLRIVREEEPPPPSSRLHETRIENVQELDWIVMKALEKDRSRRYESANGLADDVRHHLANEPVSAGPPGAGYRVRKFVRRHRGPVVAAAAVLVALVGGLIGTAWGLVEARAQKEKAQLAFQEVKRATETVQQARDTLEETLKDVQKAKQNADKQAQIAASERSVAVVERDRAKANAVRADGLRLGAESTTALRTDPGLALILASEAVKRHPHHLTFAALYNAAAELRELKTIRDVSAPLAVFPNGKGFACARPSVFNRDREKLKAVTLFDASGTPGMSWPGYGMTVKAIAVSPDGKRVATTLSGSTVAEIGEPGKAEMVVYTSRPVYVWDAATGKDVFHLKGHENGVASIEYSPDGKWLLTAGNDGIARIWDAATGELVRELKGHESSLLLARFSPDGSKVLTVTSGSIVYDTAAEAWKDADKKPRFDPGPTDRPVRLIREGPMSGGSASGGDVFAAKVWDAATGKEVATLKRARTATKLIHNWKVTQGRFSPDGKQVVLAFTDDVVGVWDAAQGGTESRLYDGHSGPVRDCTFSPSGKELATAGSDGWALARNLITGQFRQGHTLRHIGGVNAVTYGPGGTTLLSAGDDGSARVYSENAVTNLLGHNGSVTAVRLLEPADPSMVVTVGSDETARVFSLTPAPEVCRLWPAPGGNVGVHAVSPGGTRVAVTSIDAAVRILDAATGKQVCEIGNDKVLGEIRSVAFNPEGTQIVTASSVTAGYKDGKQVNFSAVHVWDATTGEDLYSFPDHKWGARSASFTADGRRVVSVSDGGTKSAGGSVSGHKIDSIHDGLVRVWDTATRKVVFEAAEKLSSVRTPAVSLDGRWMGTVGSMQGAGVYDAASGKVVWRLPDEQRPPNRLVLSPDGSRMVTTAGRAITLRRTDTGAVVWEATAAALPAWVVFAADGRSLAVAAGATVQLLDGETGKPTTTLTGHEGAVEAVEFSPDGKHVLTRGADKTAVLWDRATGKLVSVYRCPADIRFAAFTLGGKGVVTASDDGIVRLWPIDPAAELAKRAPRELTKAERLRYDLP